VSGCRGVALALAVAALLAAGCRRREEGIFVAAPFNDNARLAKLEAHWSAAAGGLRFSVEAESRLADRLFLRLGPVTAVAANGTPLATAAETRACVLNAGERAPILDGVLPLAAEGVAALEIERFGVPLSPRGLAIYREHLLQVERMSPADADAALSGYQQAPPCGNRLALHCSLDFG
jgi:hypothetical protein